MIKWLIALFLGVVLVLAAIGETRLKLRSSAAPTEYSLAELEKNPQFDNANAFIGEHYAVYSELVYEFNSRSGNRFPRPTDRVTAIWYPIISAKHPFVMESTLDPAASLENFAVLVKESDRRLAADLPFGVQNLPGMSGLFLSGVHDLGGKERELLHLSFPQVDFEKVLLIHQGRKPMSIWGVLGLYAAGLALVRMGVKFGLIDRFRKKGRPAS